MNKTYCNKLLINNLRIMKLFYQIGYSFFVLLLACNSINASAKEYPVTQAKMDSVLSHSSPGDTIVLTDGTYTDIILNLKSSGTEGNPIVLKAKTIGGVIFNGPKSRISVNANYCVIDGFQWVDVYSDSPKAVVQFSGSSNNVFRNNTIVNSGRVTPKSKTGILRLFETSRNNIIEYNRFENLINVGLQVWAWGSDISNTGNIIRYNHFVNHKAFEMIQLGQGGSSAFVNQYSIVEYNLFEDINMEDPELISCKTSYNIIRHNTFRNCLSMLVLRTGEHGLVDGNWFFNSHGIRVHDKNHIIINNYIEGPFDVSSSDDEGIALYCGNQVRPDIGNLHYPADSVLVANNTIINHMGEHILVGRNSASWPNKPKGVTIKNNLVKNNVGTSILNEASVNSVWTQNLVFPTGTGVVGNVDNVINANPLLSLVGEIYKLQAGSPAIDAANAEPAVTTDFEGQPRITPDIGADEFSDDEILHQPLDGTDVGPGIGDGVKKYLLKTSVEGLGSIIIDPISGNVYDSATVVTLTAVPAIGYEFESWNGIIGTSSTQIVIMDEDKSITANFKPLVKNIPIDTTWSTASDGNEPINTIDNDLSTRWSAEDGPQSITYQLDSLYNVEYLLIAWYQGDRRSSYFEIATSLDGIIWDTIATDTSSGTTIQQEMIDIPDTEARYVQYIGYGNSVNDWNSITEVDIHGSLVIGTGTNELDSNSGNKLQFRCYPNPFSDHTNIEFEISKAGNTLLELYDINGRKINTILNSYLTKGKHKVKYPLDSETMESNIKTGIYVIVLKTPYYMVSNKVSCIK
jgi:hypothetical protein